MRGTVLCFGQFGHYVEAGCALALRGPTPLSTVQCLCRLCRCLFHTKRNDTIQSSAQHGEMQRKCTIHECVLYNIQDSNTVGEWRPRRAICIPDTPRTQLHIHKLQES